MKILTFKLKPASAFGLILVMLGVVVIAITFVNNNVSKKTESVNAIVSAKTDEQRCKYLAGFGWSVDSEYETKELSIPTKWNEVYEAYNQVQINQGFDLTDYKGKTVTLYTYKITNHKELKDGVVADMLVYNGRLIGGDICNTSAEDGFLVGFNGE